MSLSVGLAVGLGIGGAVAGGLTKVFSEVGGAFLSIPLALAGVRDVPGKKEPSLATFVLVGGLAGGALGYGAGEGYEYLTSDSPDKPSATVQQCFDSAPEGKKVVIAQDAIGNPICSYE